MEKIRFRRPLIHTLGASMVFLAITRSRYEACRKLVDKGHPLWVCAGVLSHQELIAPRLEGVDVSDFKYKIDPHEAEVILGAVQTIKEHQTEGGPLVASLSVVPVLSLEPARVGGPPPAAQLQPQVQP